MMGDLGIAVSHCQKGFLFPQHMRNQEKYSCVQAFKDLELGLAGVQAAIKASISLGLQSAMKIVVLGGHIRYTSFIMDT